MKYLGYALLFGPPAIIIALFLQTIFLQNPLAGSIGIALVVSMVIGGYILAEVF